MDGANTNAQFDGSIQDGTGPTAITKVGSGTPTFASGSIFTWDLDTSLSGRGTTYDGMNTSAVSGSGAIFRLLRRRRTSVAVTR